MDERVDTEGGFIFLFPFSFFPFPLGLGENTCHFFFLFLFSFFSLLLCGEGKRGWELGKKFSITRRDEMEMERRKGD